jgi:hypothetical protein
LVAEEQALAGQRHAELGARRNGSRRAQREVARIGVGRIGAGDRRERGPGVVGRER